MSIWKTSSSNNLKPWGSESIFSSPFGMGGKVIKLTAGKRTSLKYYKNKNQLMYVLEGNISVFCPEEKEFGDIKSIEGSYFSLKEGDVILIQCTNPYRIKAIEDSKIIEVCVGTSTMDYVMLEDDFGRKIEIADSIKNDN